MNTKHMKHTQLMSLKQALLGLIVVMLISPGLLSAELYRWVDENGRVHYGDRVPSKYAKIERDVLNEQGRIIKTLAAEKTEEELALEAKQKVAKAQRDKELAVQTERNRVLLTSYRNLADIDLARDRKQEQLNKQIELLNVNTENLNQQQQAILTRIKLINAGDAENKSTLLAQQNAQLDTTHENLKEIIQKRSKLQAEIDGLNKIYEKEKQDYQRLIDNGQGQDQAQPQTDPDN